MSLHKKGFVCLVHCIDTEGPLNETLKATFERLKNTFNIDLKPSHRNLELLQNKKIEFNDKNITEAVAKMLSSNLLSYKKNWTEVDEMLDRIQSSLFRKKLSDSFNNGWVYNWFCLNHVGYKKNPRKRDLGFGKVYDHYKKRKLSKFDSFGFHFHPIAPKKNGIMCATSWLRESKILFEIISKYILDKNYFPTIHRPGFHTIRPDSNWFLEQFIPYDFSNQNSSLFNKEDQFQNDLSHNRFGDWSRSSFDWDPYHPHHDDYQVKGECRRWVFKCLNIGTRIRLLSDQEIRSAFESAKKNKKIVALSFTNHDFREMEDSLIDLYDKIKKISKEYKVKFMNCSAIEAARYVTKTKVIKKPGIVFSYEKLQGSLKILFCSKKPTFGPQPFFCYKTLNGKYYYDNMDIIKPFYKWSYVFDWQNHNWNEIEKVAAAVSYKCGSYEISIIGKNMRETKVFKNFAKENE